MCCHVRGVPVTSAWVLDSASDVHVCQESSVLHNVRMNNVYVFQRYDETACKKEQVGDVTLRGKMELLLAKNHRRYRLKAIVATIYRIPLLQTGEQDNCAAQEDLHSVAREVVFVLCSPKFCDYITNGSQRSYCWYGKRCKASKLTQMSNTNTVSRRATRPYQNLMSDMCCDAQWTTRYLWGFLMRRKQDAAEVAMAHLKWLTAQCHRIETTKALLEAVDIEFIWTNAFSPEGNKLARRRRNCDGSNSMFAVRSKHAELFEG
ncbi:hypothetical protein GN958_ATG01396 [Phytophthora infestans]|uniref:Uncharacterized protein n=1 Tax=Phytophthora infestans TaxID=4787 RepID=A0A8S9VDC7_PHYIN|nr:hypothetical protein GN958_ATG01396 [Phytophthora infestans]